MSFALLGPPCVNPLHYSSLLKSCAEANQSKVVRSEQSRATMRKSTGREADVERQERNRNAITMQTNCDIATIALANQEAREHALDRELLAINSQIDGKKVEMQATQTLLAGAVDAEDAALYRSELISLRAELRDLTTQLTSFRSGTTVTPIVLVDNLLANAETMMGLNTRRATVTSIIEGGTQDNDVGEDGAE